jgi:hypothetical protein
LNLGERKAGIYVSKNKAAYWDGRDDVGEKVGSGVYFCTLQVEPTEVIQPSFLVWRNEGNNISQGKQSTSEGGAGSFRMTRKMVILK